MQKKVTKCNFTFLVLYLLLSCSNTFAQTTKKNTLSEIFKSLENTFDIRFSYSSNDFKELYIEPIPVNKSLNESLVYLELKTPYTYTKIDQRYITVVLKVREEIRCLKVINALTNEPLSEAMLCIIKLCG